VSLLLSSRTSTKHVVDLTDDGNGGLSASTGKTEWSVLKSERRNTKQSSSGKDVVDVTRNTIDLTAEEKSAKSNLTGNSNEPCEVISLMDSDVPNDKRLSVNVEGETQSTLVDDKVVTKPSKSTLEPATAVVVSVPSFDTKVMKDTNASPVSGIVVKSLDAGVSSKEKNNVFIEKNNTLSSVVIKAGVAPVTGVYTVTSVHPKNLISTKQTDVPFTNLDWRTSSKQLIVASDAPLCVDGRSRLLDVKNELSHDKHSKNDAQADTKNKPSRVKNKVSAAGCKPDLSVDGQARMFIERTVAIRKKLELFKNKTAELTADKKDLPSASISDHVKDQSSTNMNGEVAVDESNTQLLKDKDGQFVDKKSTVSPGDKEDVMSRETKTCMLADKELLLVVDKDLLSAKRKASVSAGNANMILSDKKELLSVDNLDTKDSADKKELLSVDKKESLPADNKDLLSVDKTQLPSVDKKDMLSVDRKDLLSVDKNELLSVDKKELSSVDKKSDHSMKKEVQSTKAKESALTTEKINDSLEKEAKTSRHSPSRRRSSRTETERDGGRARSQNKPSEVRDTLGRPEAR